MFGSFYVRRGHFLIPVGSQPPRARHFTSSGAGPTTRRGNEVSTIQTYGLRRDSGLFFKVVLTIGFIFLQAISSIGKVYNGRFVLRHLLGNFIRGHVVICSHINGRVLYRRVLVRFFGVFYDCQTSNRVLFQFGVPPSFSMGRRVMTLGNTFLGT